MQIISLVLLIYVFRWYFIIKWLKFTIYGSFGYVILVGISPYHKKYPPPKAVSASSTPSQMWTIPVTAAQENLQKSVKKVAYFILGEYGPFSRNSLEFIFLRKWKLIFNWFDQIRILQVQVKSLYDNFQITFTCYRLI